MSARGRRRLSRTRRRFAPATPTCPITSIISAIWSSGADGWREIISRSPTSPPRRISRASTISATRRDRPSRRATMISGISAVTLATHDMRHAVAFYRLLGLPLLYGGEDATFTSFRAGDNYLNLIAQPADRQWTWWGRLIFYDSD